MDDDAPWSAGAPRLGKTMRDAQESLRAAICAGHQLALERLDLKREVEQLLSRLNEIDAELNSYRRQPPLPSSGELYPFWVELARRARS